MRSTFLAFLAMMALSMIPVSVSALQADGAPTLDAGTSQGMYVWRMPNGSWRLRLKANVSGFTKATVLLTATKAYQWVSQVGIEDHDTLMRDTTKNLIGLDLKVWAPKDDGIDFSIPAGAGVCLSAIGEAITVKLGASQVPLTTPIDLTQSGACGVASGGRKYNPGHYVSMNRFDITNTMYEALEPGIRGVQWRYMWKDLEPNFGKYDFSKVRADLQLLAGQGRQLVVLIEDKTFKNQMPTPPYLQADHTLSTRQGGYVAKRWDPYVVTRMKALIAALGREFDSHPNFEGVGIQESALSLNDFVLANNGYTPEKYRDSLIEVLTSASQSLPTSRVFWYMNFLEDKQSYIGDIAAAVAPLDVTMGGPDILPDAWTLYTHTYPFYDQFQSRMKLFGSMQFDSYSHVHKDTSYPTKYWTMGEMFRFARDSLHVNYIFWNRKSWREPWDSYEWADAIPVINNNRRFNQ